MAFFSRKDSFIENIVSDDLSSLMKIGNDEINSDKNYKLN